ncbi:SpoIIE family protein phosphatase [Candidatus Poribacteria bacterium]|nr:SpoIIE family protein phosphatase [Candidatus Poribacteria bacterium]MYK21283.1 SpoIIE family protein phosphatase [Candidatus Poribacteria bacterium]
MLPEEEKLQFLKKTELFAELPETELKSICQIASEVAYPADATLFEEGDEGDSLYLIVNGEVSIIKAGTEVLFFNEKGYCLGEIALIDNKPRSATVKTVKSTQFLRITRHDFYNAMMREPRIGSGMFRVLNDKIRRDLEIQMSAIRKEIAQEESMRLAAEVQQSLLPNQEISHPCISSAGYCRPANSVGGDYYDYLRLADNSIAIFLGDVMGHGYHSAMVAAMTKSCLQTQIPFDASVPEVMKAITRVIEDSQTFIYMTCCYLIIHPDNRFEFANAGHPQMLLYRGDNSDPLELKSSFMPVGFPKFDEVEQYYSTEVEWHSGDLLVLYSDGITEAFNPDAEMYGLERFKALISEKRHLSPMEIKAEILSDLQAYQQDESTNDDLTLVVAKFL